MKEKKTLRIYIGGVGGVGKTTIGEELAKRHQMEYFPGSRIMMALCGVNSREALSGVSKKKKTALEKKEYPCFVMKNPRVIIDGHCQLLPKQAKCFDRFIFLEAPKETIKLRRKQRGRRHTDLRIIQREQKEYKERVFKTERECGIQFVIVSNAGTVNETCDSMKKIIEENNE